MFYHGMVCFSDSNNIIIMKIRGKCQPERVPPVSQIPTMYVLYIQYGDRISLGALFSLQLVLTDSLPMYLSG